MGMYTELNISVKFKEDAPKEIIDAVAYMATGEGERNFPMTHVLFEEGTRWDWMLRSGGSYYFDAQPTLVWRFDEIGKDWCLTLCTNIKNYHGEWQRFLDFIGPHLSTDGYIGTYRYEEEDKPTLLFVRGGEVVFEKIGAQS